MKLNDEYFHELTNKYMMGSQSGSKAEQHRHLYLLLKQVCKDTRHACAEVRVKNDPGMGYGFIDGVTKEYASGYDAGFHIGQETHADACMNV